MAKTSNTKSLFAREGVVLPQGFYSGDKPNSNILLFIKSSSDISLGGKEATEPDRPAFRNAIQTTKVDPIYNMHSYDSKKSHLAIQEYIRHYCKPGDIVLDPFCGSGSTLVAASAHGCRSIGIDFSPLSTFISSEAIRPRSSKELDDQFAVLRKRVENKIQDLYATTCHRCKGKATITGSVLSERFQCLKCCEVHPYYSCLPTKDEGVRHCPSCHNTGSDSEITTSFERKGAVIVEVAFECHGSCKPSRAKRSVLDSEPTARAALARDAELAAAIKVPNPLPEFLRRRMLNAPAQQERWGLLWRPYLRGINTVADFFTTRNLTACLLLHQAISEIGDSALRLALSSILAKASHLMAQNPDGIGRVMKGTYYVGVLRREVNVWRFYSEAFEAIRKGKVALNDTVQAPAMLSCQDSRDLSNIPNNSIDYIFTDPPYSGKVQFGELNFLREAFILGQTADLSREIIVNEERGLEESDWVGRMKLVAEEMYRVLKPGRWATLCYHDTSEGTWAYVQDIMAEVGFVPDTIENTLYIETRQKSIKQITGSQVTKRDLVINFRKPKPGDWLVTRLYIPADADVPTFRDLARRIIRDYLARHPGALKDRIYDELVSRMVRSGQMQVCNFDEILEEVAEEVKQPRPKNLFENQSPDLFGTHVASRWYLKESAESEMDAAESALEDAAADKLGKFIREYLEKDKTREGVHYSDLFEQFVSTTRECPRRQLADWLPDYFCKTLGGTWRLPTPEEEEAKARGRQAGTNRRVRQFLSMLDSGEEIPERLRPNPSDLAAWIRHCQRSGMYEEGRRLYLHGGGDWRTRLTEEAQVSVDEDFNICQSRLNQTTAPTAKKRAKKADAQKNQTPAAPTSKRGQKPGGKPKK